MTDRKRIDVALVERGLFPSRAKAREAIEAGLVYVQDRKIGKPSEEIDAGAKISARPPYPWVSRGGVKLEAALAAFGIDLNGLVCVDIGASTGGFTHVLLERGAARVYAVDVGQGQLHGSLASDARVVAMEKTDARDLKHEDFAVPPQLVVSDVSFISLKLALPRILSLASADARLVSLVKPQFEAGRERVSKGIVRDPRVHEEVCTDVRLWLERIGWRVIGLIPSPIEGGDGNREFLIAAERNEG